MASRTVLDGRPSRVRPTSLAALSVLVLALVAGAMLVATGLQRTAERQSAENARASQDMLVAVLDLETGLRGYILAGDPSFLAPFQRGRTEFAAAVARAQRTLPDDPRVQRLLAGQAAAIDAWRTRADLRVATVRRAAEGGRVPRADQAGGRERKRFIDRFRLLNARTDARLAELGAASRRTAAVLSLLIVLGVVGALAVAAYLLLVRSVQRRERRARAELAHRRDQRELLDAVQVVSDEREAHLLVQRHLERVVPGASATVLQRNNSDDRLVPGTALPDGSPLIDRLEDAGPRSCLAIRQARGHVRAPDTEPLLVCPVCGDLPAASACEPFLVGGTVIGSVLVDREAALGRTETSRIGEAVALAGPTLANLRTLAIAEARASTDALTGLANRREATGALARLAAESERRAQPMSALAIDLDHFKRINDGFGHDAGDAVLAATGAALRRHVRNDDVVARMGGEEFLVLLPGAGLERAVDLAERLRREIADTHVPGLDIPLTGSVGVAVMPVHATTAETLVRQADRALYRAKDLGRDRVEVAAAAQPDIDLVEEPAADVPT